MLGILHPPPSRFRLPHIIEAIKQAAFHAGEKSRMGGNKIDQAKGQKADDERKERFPDHGILDKEFGLACLFRTDVSTEAMGIVV